MSDRFEKRSAQLRQSIIQGDRRKGHPVFKMPLAEWRAWLGKQAYVQESGCHRLALADESKNGRIVWHCSYCTGSFPIDDITIDHAIPRAEGGISAVENFVVCCRRCNLRKGALRDRSFRRLLAWARELSPAEAGDFWRRLTSRTQHAWRKQA